MTTNNDAEDFRLRLSQLRGKKKTSELPLITLKSTPTDLNQKTENNHASKKPQKAQSWKEKQDALKANMLAKLSLYQQGSQELDDLDFHDTEDAEDELKVSLIHSEQGPIHSYYQEFQETSSHSFMPIDTSTIKTEGVNAVDDELSFQNQESRASKTSGHTPSGKQTAESATHSVSLQNYLPFEVVEVNASKPAKKNRNKNSEQPLVTEADQRALNAANELIKPGVLCKAVVLKPSGSSFGLSSWELCFRKYDTLSQDLRFFEEIKFLHTPPKLMYNSFATQEMMADLVLKSAVIKSMLLHDGSDYHYVEIKTLNQNHTIILYPVPELTGERLVMLHFDENDIKLMNVSSLSTQSNRKILGFMKHPLRLNQSILSDLPIEFQALNQEVKYFEPLYDIEKKLKRGQAVHASRETYQVFVAQPNSDDWLRLRLESVRQDKIIAYLKKIALQNWPNSRLQAYLENFAPHMITRWDASPQSRWFFSSVFSNQMQNGLIRYQVIAILEKHYSGKPIMLPYLFENYYDQQGQAVLPCWYARISDCFVEQLLPEQKYEIQEALQLQTFFEPSSYLQLILEHQALSIARIELEEFFPLLDMELLKKNYTVRPRYSFKDPEWQAFIDESRALSDVFELLKDLSLLDTPDDLIDRRIHDLMNNKSLSKQIRRQLKQRFLEFREHNAQFFKHGDQEHYIFEFWQTFFQVLFQSVHIPDSLKQFKPYSQPYKMTIAERNVSLEVYQCENQYGESLHWVIQRDLESQNIMLYDILLAEDHLGMSLDLPVFGFTKAFQALPKDVQMFIQAHWLAFEPIAILAQYKQ